MPNSSRNQAQKKAQLFSVGIDDVDLVATPVVETLGAKDYFCLWLKGDLGAGKTFLVGALLKKMGLDPRIPVTSPTYTYVNDYEISGMTYAHFDLYRAAESFDFDELGVFDTNSYRGVFIEWPERIKNHHPQSLATHQMEISYSENRRIYEFKSIEP